MIPLEQIRVASPCSASWAEMEGTKQVRFFQGCCKNVYNLSEMSRPEAEALVTRLEGHLCVRFYTRADGTMLTRDCPVGLRAMRIKLAKNLSYAVALLLASVSGLLRGAKADPVRHHKNLALPALAESKFPRTLPPKPAMVGSPPPIMVLNTDAANEVVPPTFFHISLGIMMPLNPPNLPPPPGHTRR